MQNILIGLISLALGFLIIWKTEWIVQNFGYNDWAEYKLGSSGGTRLLYKLIGLAMMIFGMLVATGLLKNVLFSVFGKIFRT